MPNTTIKKGTIYITAASMIFMITGYLSNIWLGRYFGPALYGSYGVIISLWSSVNLVLVAGLPQAVSRNIALNEKQSEEILKSGIILQIILTIAITIIYYFSAPLISSLLNDQSLTVYIQLSAFILPIYSAYSFYGSYQNGLHNFKLQALMTIIYSVIKLIGVIVLSYYFYLIGTIWAFIFAPIIALYPGLHIPKLSTKSFPYKSLILFSIPLTAFTLSSSLQQTIELFFIKALVESTNAPGYYTAIENIARIPFIALNAFSIILFPSIARSMNNVNKVKSIIITSIRIVLIFLIPGITIISATSEQTLEFLYAKEYLPASGSLSVLVLSFGFFTIFSILTSIINGYGKPLLSLAFGLTGLFTTSFLCYVFIPTLNLMGAAIAASIGNFFALSLSFYEVNKKYKNILNLKSLIRILIASLVIFFLANFIIFKQLYLPILYIVLFTIYIILLVIFKELSLTELSTIIKLMPINLTSFKYTKKHE